MSLPHKAKVHRFLFTLFILGIFLVVSVLYYMAKRPSADMSPYGQPWDAQNLPGPDVLSGWLTHGCAANSFIFKGLDNETNRFYGYVREMSVNYDYANTNLYKALAKSVNQTVVLEITPEPVNGVRSMNITAVGVTAVGGSDAGLPYRTKRTGTIEYLEGLPCGKYRIVDANGAATYLATYDPKILAILALEKGKVSSVEGDAWITRKENETDSKEYMQVLRVGGYGAPLATPKPNPTSTSISHGVDPGKQPPPPPVAIQPTPRASFPPSSSNTGSQTGSGSTGVKESGQSTRYYSDGTAYSEGEAPSSVASSSQSTEDSVAEADEATESESPFKLPKNVLIALGILALIICLAIWYYRM